MKINQVLIGTVGLASSVALVACNNGSSTNPQPSPQSYEIEMVAESGQIVTGQTFKYLVGVVSADKSSTSSVNVSLTDQSENKNKITCSPPQSIQMNSVVEFTCTAPSLEIPAVEDSKSIGNHQMYASSANAARGQSLNVRASGVVFVGQVAPTHVLPGGVFHIEFQPSEAYGAYKVLLPGNGWSFVGNTEANGVCYFNPSSDEACSVLLKSPESATAGEVKVRYGKMDVDFSDFGNGDSPYGGVLDFIID